MRRRLREAYGLKVDEREARTPPAWEVGERDAFVSLLQREEKRSVLELGAGTGVDSACFQDHGFAVVCTDLSPAMVSRCQAKGLAACVMDVAALHFPPDAFDAVYAMNCLRRILDRGDRGQPHLEVDGTVLSWAVRGL